MPRMPWMKFFPSDWVSCPELLCCSWASRGLWVHVVCILHQSPHRGVLEGKDGSPMTDDTLLRICNAGSDGAAMLKELEAMGVFSRDERGAIVCRRMVRDEEISRARSEAGVRGGTKRAEQMSPPHSGGGLPRRLPTDLPKPLSTDLPKQNVMSASASASGVSPKGIVDVVVEAGEAQRREDCAQWLTRRPDWLPDDVGWITLPEARKAIQRRPGLTTTEVQAIYADARRNRRGLKNPAGYVVSRIKELATP